jgi:hypothetical protein
MNKECKIVRPKDYKNPKEECQCCGGHVDENGVCFNLDCLISRK